MAFKYFLVKDKTPVDSGSWKTNAKEEPEDLRNGANGWGIPTGKEAGFWVLDFDNKHGGMDKYEELRAQGLLPNTYTVKTRSSGRHLYFKYPRDGKIKQTQGLFPGVDTRSDGGYVVAAGSEGYEGDDGDILETPDWLLKLVQIFDNNETGKILKETEYTGVKGELNKRSLAFVAQGALPGTWHQELVQATFNCKQQGYSLEEAIELLSKATGHLDDSHDIPTIQDIYFNRQNQYESDIPDVMIIKAQSLFIEMKSYLIDPRQVSGLNTGIEGLDALLGGGVRPGEVIGVLAPAKTGKSSFTHKLVHSFMRQGHHVGYASREMRPAEEVMPNLLSIELGASIYKDIDRVEEGMTRAGGWGLYFTPGYGYLALEELEEFYKQAYQAGVRIFLLDHFHHFLPSEDYSEIQRFAKRIKTLTIEYKVTTILVIQPKTLKLDQTRITNADIRGGAVVGQALDAVIVLERQRDVNNRATNVVKVTLDVARHKLARPGSIYLSYDDQSQDFTEVEEVIESKNDEPPVIISSLGEGDRDNNQGLLGKRLN